jgi:hypothetical protein
MIRGHALTRPSDIVTVAKALMGTAAAGGGQERPGDGASPGACPADQITPELPEQRPLPRLPYQAGAAQ